MCCVHLHFSDFNVLFFQKKTCCSLLLKTITCCAKREKKITCREEKSQPPPPPPLDIKWSVPNLFDLYSSFAVMVTKTFILGSEISFFRSKFHHEKPDLESLKI